MAVIGLVWGILAFVGMIVAFTPCLGSLNWIIIPFAAIGVIISSFALGKRSYTSRNLAVTAVALNVIALFLAIIRLFIGGGIF
jgi:thiamine transporter ThiT